MANQGEKAGGPIVGNGIAYFIVVLILIKNGYIEKDDAAEAVAFGGAIVTYGLLQVGTVVRFFADIIKKRASSK